MIRKPSAQQLLRFQQSFVCDVYAGGIYNQTDRGRRAKAGQIAGSLNPDGYWVITCDGVNWLAHQLVWFFAHGQWPEFPVDHRNGNRLDNRIPNLRLATGSINAQNQRRAHLDSLSGLLGVSWHSRRRRWRARIRAGGKDVELGLYQSAEAAHAAYLAAKKVFHVEQSSAP